jgi:alanine racemase
MLAVATVEEATSLPLAAESLVPVLLLRPAENAFLGRQREGIDLAIHRGWTLTVGTAAAADDVARIAQARGRRAAVHVMVDTGMNRCGTPVSAVADLISHIRSRQGLRLVSLGTHFACSEVPDEQMNADQLARFRGATDEIAAADPRLIRHAANSGAIFFSPDSHFEVVRPGIALYGIDPTGRPSIHRPLRPVMRWTAPLLTVRDAPAGESVGYGQTWRIARDSRLGLVPIGYADGYPRAYSNKAGMLVDGQFAPVVGRVSMDLTVIDLTDIPGARAGDEVTVLDSDPLSPVSAYRLAEWAGTIAYEVFCRIGPRVKRVSLETVETAAVERASSSDLVE